MGSKESYEWREKLMNLEDTTLIDELGRYILPQYGTTALICEALRRILIKLMELKETHK